MAKPSTLALGRITVDLRSVRVLRASADVRARLRAAPPEAGRVHSVFERAVNLAWHDGRLLTLQGPGPLVAPFAAALARLPRAGAVGAGMRVRRRADTLALDGAILEWQGATIVDTTMPEGNGGPGSALSALLTESPAEGAPGLRSTLARRARSRLAAGLSRRDPEAFREGALALLGLGEGLTPAGDDCLVGALAVTHRFAGRWLRAHPQIQASVERTAAVATTAIGREFVAHALAGHFAESLIALVTAESTEGVSRAAARLLESGATSGTDTLCGMRLALDALRAT